jgi:hypothetical protein
LTTRAARTRASQDATAYLLANRIFDAALPYFGRNTRMPLIYFRSRTPGRHPWIDMPGSAVAMAWPRGMVRDTAARQLGVVAYPYRRLPDVSQWKHDPLQRYAFRAGDLSRPSRRQRFADSLIHELAHTQQAALPLRDIRSHKLELEGGADAFTVLARNRIFANAGLGRPLQPYVTPYAALAADFLNKYGRGMALFGQFPHRGGKMLFPVAQVRG